MNVYDGGLSAAPWMLNLIIRYVIDFYPNEANNMTYYYNIILLCASALR